VTSPASFTPPQRTSTGWCRQFRTLVETHVHATGFDNSADLCTEVLAHIQTTGT